MTRLRMKLFAGAALTVAASLTANTVFADEALDYALEESFAAKFRNPALRAAGAPAEIKIGAFEHMAESGRTCDISSACHWAVNMAATADHGRMWGHAYSVTPSAIWAPPESDIRRPEDLAGQDVLQDQGA